MIGLKKLDLYILKKFLLIYVGAFFICQFVFMMQATWKYVDELIGKGLTMDILGQFFWYMALTLVPQALPLSILLASLITFGNLGESLELLSMKAAGVPLLRIMRPAGIFAAFMMGVSFYFQNNTSPQAQISLRTLLISMKQQSPAVEIPEGVFYNGVPNINIFVQKKNAATGMLYQTIIYKTDQGFDRAQIVLADSARLEMTRDKMHLRLDLWNGALYESLKGNNGGGMASDNAEEPFDREAFIYKQLLIDFDSNFNMLDKDMLSGMAQAKSMRQIEHSVDSMEHAQDSVGKAYYNDTKLRYFTAATQLSRKDSLNLVKMVEKSDVPDFGKLVDGMANDERQRVENVTRQAVQSMRSDLEWKTLNTGDTDSTIRRHWVEWYKKITYSLACLVFFFVGAPLGAIIRKGGLGLPTVISVAIFIFWYILDTSGMKMARDGSINMGFGMWVSMIVIAPFGIFITYKANRDSVVFNIDAYKNFVFRLLALRTKRNICMKEVILNAPQTDVVTEKISALKEACRDYNASHKLLRTPEYVSTFFHYKPDTVVEIINQQLEEIVEELSNSQDYKIIALLNKLPILYVTAHTTPFHSHRLNVAAGIVFPIGLILWLRIWRFRLRLLRDMKTVVRICDQLQSVMQGTTGEPESTAPDADEIKRQKRRKRLRRVLKVLLLLIILALLSNIAWRGWETQSRKRLMQRMEQTITPNPAHATPTDTKGI